MGSPPGWNTTIGCWSWSVIEGCRPALVRSTSAAPKASVGSDLVAAMQEQQTGRCTNSQIDSQIDT